MSAEEKDESMGGTEASGEDAGLSDALAGEEQSFVTGAQKAAASKKPLIVLGLALAGGAGYFFMHSRHSAEIASAETTTVESASADQTINTFLDKGHDNLKSMQKMLHNTEKIVEQFRTYPTVTQIPLTDLKTNPFKLQNGKDEDAGTSSAKKRESERQTALRGVQDLHLQSIMHGTRRSCMINNALYTEGQQIDAFTVEKITPGSVIVRSGPYRFELKMQK